MLCIHVIYLLTSLTSGFIMLFPAWLLKTAIFTRRIYIYTFRTSNICYQVVFCWMPANKLEYFLFIFNDESSRLSSLKGIEIDTNKPKRSCFANNINHTFYLWWNFQYNEVCKCVQIGNVYQARLRTHNTQRVLA